MVKIIDVAVGIIRQDNMVLLSSRPHDKSYTGHWEFPGGKIEQGEDAVAATVRELAEEIGVIVDAASCVHFANIEQSYTHGLVKLSLVSVGKYTGVPIGLEAQKLFWQDLETECILSPLLPTTVKILKMLHKYPS